MPDNEREEGPLGLDGYHTACTNFELNRSC